MTQEQSIYPIYENEGLVNSVEIEAYLDWMFAHVDWGEQVFSVRGIGEKGTPKEGTFKEQLWHRPEGLNMTELVRRAAARYAQYHVATFIVPAVLKGEVMETREARLEGMAAFTTLVVDIDSGNTDEKLAWLKENIGQPGLIVRSGGMADEGTPKRHVYWRLSEPSDEIDRIARLRETLALKCGGDPSFKRAPQIVRVPGTVHGKNGVIGRASIEAMHHIPDADLDDIAERIEAANPMPGLPVIAADTVSPALDFSGTGAMDFSPVAGLERSSAKSALTSDVHEGGSGKETRWDNFNTAAGYHIRLARFGTIELDEAAKLTMDWMNTHMHPAWPDERFRSEFQGLINVDIAAHGPFPGVIPAAPIEIGHKDTPGLTPITHTKFNRSIPALGGYDVGQWAMGTPPKRRHLVQGLIMAGQTHLLAAEGGAGKTFLCIDLGLRLAAAGNRPNPEAEEVLWMGQPVTHEAAGGTVVMITAEDAMDELHIRLSDIDPTGELRLAAAGKFRILPLIDEGGAFPFVLYDANRQPVPSPRWAQLLEAIGQIQANGGHVSAVVVDTMSATLHGEDISGSVVKEYFNELGRLCGDLGAAVVVTHHIRKGDDKNPIRNLDDMRSAIRGSGAAVNGPRVVLGFWHAHNYHSRLRELGETPDRGKLYYAGVVKANNPELFSGMKTLLRAESGLLEDVSSQIKAPDAVRVERIAWLVLAVRQAAADRYPLTKANANGLFSRRKQLPHALRNIPKREFDTLVDMAMDQGLIVRGALVNKPGTSGYLDVPGGPIDRKQGYADEGVWHPDWGVWVYDPSISDVTLAG